jgi:hypothetical protein
VIGGLNIFVNSIGYIDVESASFPGDRMIKYFDKNILESV